MFKWIEGITIFSDNAKLLADFYEKMLDLKLVNVTPSGLNGEQTYEFQVGEGYLPLLIADSVEVCGRNLDPHRRVFRFQVNNIEEAAKKLLESKVSMIREITTIEDYGKVAIFADPDNNYFQLVEPVS